MIKHISLDMETYKSELNAIFNTKQIVPYICFIL